MTLLMLAKGTFINDVYFFFWGGGGSKMTPKNRTLEGKKSLGGDRRSKMTKKADIIYGCPGYLMCLPMLTSVRYQQGRRRVWKSGGKVVM